MIDVERLLISKIIEDGDLTPALDLNLTSEFFKGDASQKAWEWVYGYWAKHQAVPTYDAFRRKFPGYDLAGSVDEPISALVAEVFDAYRRRLVQEGLQEAVDEFDATDDAEPALDALQRLMTKVNVELSKSTVESAQDFIEDLIAQYVNAEEDSMAGIPTGLTIIDDACGGLLPEQLIVMVGLPKRMKSSFLLYMAMTAMYSGYRAGLMSFEMSNAEQKARFTSLGAHVPLTAILRGQLTERQISALHTFEEKILDEEMGQLLLVHDVSSTTTVGGVAAKVQQLNLDVIFIDGVYLMDDELGEDKGSSQALTNITRSLKRMAQVLKIPVVCTTQALFARTTRKRGIDMNSIAYSSSFAQDADILLGIDRDDLTQPVARFKVVAARNALGAESEVSVDYVTGRVTDRGMLSTFDGGAYVEYPEDEPEEY